MHVHDCAEQFVETCMRPDPMKRLVYNSGTGEYRSVGEMAELAAGLSPGASIDFERDGASPTVESLADYDFADVSSEALRDELGWRARFDFTTGIRNCADHWLGLSAADVAATARL